jgi:catechol 2,3-dioxygenase-like lactoylglutathione lyase family enzyme
MKLNHTRLLVNNFPACFRFYRQVMQLEPSWGDENDSYASFTQAGQASIVLALFRRPEMAKVVGRADWPGDAQAQDRHMLIFTVANLDETVEKLKKQKVQFVTDPMDFPDWGMRGAYLRDPDGNLIELSGELSQDSWSESLREANKKWNPKNE